MSYILYGSQTSPFVRRIRLLMESTPYSFKEMDIFKGPDVETLKKINPINQILVLSDGEKTIWDSRQIFEYLNEKHQFQKMDWKDANLLTALEGAMNAGVALLLMKRSGINLDEPIMYAQRQKERIESVLDFVTPLVDESPLKDWNFHSMTLYSFLDWGNFRGIFKLDNRPKMQEYLKRHADRSIVSSTQIPRT